MKNTFLAAALAVAGAGAAAPALAAQVTWYVTGHMQTAAAGTPADLSALVPAGAVFSASFSFDSASASTPISIISGLRYDFVTSSALGATSLDVNGKHFASQGSSRIIEQADFNGESVTLNGGAVTGPVPSNYGFAALDVLTIAHRGPDTAPNGAKYPWFSPFGSGGSFVMISSAAPPDLTRSDQPATLDLFFYETATSNYYHRIGTIEAISTSPVPEPASALLLAGGLAGLLARRRGAREGGAA